MTASSQAPVSAFSRPVVEALVYSTAFTPVSRKFR